MRALILAAGYATRLYPLTKKYPKPLLKVNDKPIIEHIIGKLLELKGLEDITVVTNSKFFSIFKYWCEHFKCPVKVNILDDLTKDLDDRRGAIGDLDFAIRECKIKSSLLVVGGDNLLGSSLVPFLDFARKNEPDPTIGVFDIKEISQAKNYGVLKLGQAGQITDFQEKPEKPESALVAMCLYYFPVPSLALVEKYMKANSEKLDAAGFYIDWLRKQSKVFGYVFSGSWFDIGDKEFYKKAQDLYKKSQDAFNNNTPR